MNNGQRQIIAEKVAATVRVLEMLGLNYTVSAPKLPKKKGNKSPRVVTVDLGRTNKLRVYNGRGGSTWANFGNGTPIPSIKSNEDLYEFLKENHR